MDTLLTTKQVLEILQINKLDTIYKYITTGKLRAHKLGGNGKSKRHWRVWQRDLEAFITGEVSTSPVHSVSMLNKESKK